MLAPAFDLSYFLIMAMRLVSKDGLFRQQQILLFALGVMALLGRRVPVELKVFLLALAIIDDLGVIVIVALFISKSVALVPLYIGSANYHHVVYS